jgi:hypothetical protein
LAPIGIKTHMVNAHMVSAHMVSANVRIACRIIDASRSVSKPASRSRDGGRNAATEIVTPAGQAAV